MNEGFRELLHYVQGQRRLISFMWQVMSLLGINVQWNKWWKQPLEQLQKGKALQWMDLEITSPYFLCDWFRGEKY
jgi:hypothetical protein